MELKRGFTVLLVLLLVLIAILDVTEAKKRGDKKRKGGKTSAKKTRRGKQTVQACGLPACVRDKTLAECRPEMDAYNGVTLKLPGIADASLEEVNAALHATTKHMEKFSVSLESLLSGRFDVYPERGIKELNPTVDKTKLTTDPTQYKLLGQMLWWNTWIDASLQVIHTISQKATNPSELVPASDAANLTSTLDDLLRVQRSLDVILYFVGGRDKLDEIQGGKSKGSKKSANPFECQKMRVTSACKKKSGPICSEEKDRAYVVLRDIQKAAKRMLEVFQGCRVEESSEGGDLPRFVLKCKNKAVFYMKRCQKELCPIQKKRCKCITWGYA